MADRKVLPDDIDTTAQYMTVRGLAEHYKWSPHTMRAVLKRERPDLHAVAVENGLAYKRDVGRRNGSLGAVAARLAHIQKQREAKAGIAATKAPMRKVQLAARYLQKWGSCYALSVRFPEREGYWFYGREWSDAELIAEAKRRGWVPLDEMNLRGEK